ncbi:hypothetical protein GC207_12635 [bacterium]|nr:hypothetical protein [bacterium]
MTTASKPSNRRMGVTVALVILALYYAVVFRPLAQKEEDQMKPFEQVQAQLKAAATNNPAISGLSLEPLRQLNDSLRASLTNTALARDLIARRFAPEPVIATNLSRTFQLIDYQNERLSRGDRLINFAGERKVKITPAVTAGLPEFTIENPMPELLWGQLALMDGVLRAAVEAGLQSIEDVDMPDPINHASPTSTHSRLIELPLHVEVTGTAEAVSRWLAMVLLDPAGREAYKLPKVEGLPGACLHHILARKENTDQPSINRVSVEFDGFLLMPPTTDSTYNSNN